MKNILKRFLFLLLIFMLGIVLFSSVSRAETKDYYITVNYNTNVVTIYTQDSSGNFTVPYKSMVCSTGTATPKSGTYTLNYKYRWLALVGGVYGQYCTRITGSILFHSVPYMQNGNPGSLEYWEYDKLGTSASAGCIRLTVQDAKWIYENCSNNTKVTFISDNSNGPLGKPKALKISNSEYRNWDPTDTSSNNLWNKEIGITFNAKFYADNYPDLKNAYGYDEIELTNHWINLGVYEGRVASPLFDVKYYLNTYPDLKSAFENNYLLAHAHFVEFGIDEGRRGSDVFNVDLYRFLNEDLSQMSEKEAINHYIEFGINEGRIAYIPEKIEKAIFDAEFYSDQYEDLQEAFDGDEKLLREHWYKFGIKEGRITSEIFNIKDYLKYNSDLQTAFNEDYKSLLIHFITCGVNEGRRTSGSFDIKVYKSENSDLQEAYGDENIEYYNHYINFGKKEKRKCV